MASKEDPWYTRSIQLVLVASWGFVLIQGAHDGASLMVDPGITFMYFLKWCLLAAVTGPPIAGVVWLIDRTAPFLQRAIDEGADERRWIAAGTFALIWAPVWLVVWQGIVIPVDQNATWLLFVVWLAGSVALTSFPSKGSGSPTHVIRQVYRNPPGGSARTAAATSWRGQMSEADRVRFVIRWVFICLAFIAAYIGLMLLVNAIWGPEVARTIRDPFGDWVLARSSTT